MRKVGEVGFNRIPNQRRTRDQIANGRKANKRTVLVKCSTCEYKAVLSELFLAQLGKAGRTYKCRQCREREQKEMNQALMNLAKRKGLI